MPTTRKPFTMPITRKRSTKQKREELSEMIAYEVVPEDAEDSFRTPGSEEAEVSVRMKRVRTQESHAPRPFVDHNNIGDILCGRHCGGHGKREANTFFRSLLYHHRDFYDGLGHNSPNKRLVCEVILDYIHENGGSFIVLPKEGFQFDLIRHLTKDEAIQKVSQTFRDFRGGRVSPVVIERAKQLSFDQELRKKIEDAVVSRRRRKKYLPRRKPPQQPKTPSRKDPPRPPPVPDTPGTRTSPRLLSKTKKSAGLPVVVTPASAAPAVASVRMPTKDHATPVATKMQRRVTLDTSSNSVPAASSKATDSYAQQLPSLQRPTNQGSTRPRRVSLEPPKAYEPDPIRRSSSKRKNKRSKTEATRKKRRVQMAVPEAVQDVSLTSELIATPTKTPPILEQADRARASPLDPISPISTMVRTLTTTTSPADPLSFLESQVSIPDLRIRSPRPEFDLRSSLSTPFWNPNSFWDIDGTNCDDTTPARSIFDDPPPVSQVSTETSGTSPHETPSREDGLPPPTWNIGSISTTIIQHIEWNRCSEEIMQL